MFILAFFRTFRLVLFQLSEWLYCNYKHLQYICPSSGPFTETINQHSNSQASH